MTNKKTLSEAQINQRRAAGRACAEKYGSDYMRAIGYQGYLAVYEKYGDEWHVWGGEASWRKQNSQMIQDGYFPNQSLGMWGYDVMPDLGDNRMN